MGTYWYAYSGRVAGPFFETKAEAAEACDDGETPRPVADSVLPDDIDLRSKESIRDALRS